MPPKKRALEETDANAQDRVPKSSKHIHAEEAENGPPAKEVVIVDNEVEDTELGPHTLEGKKDSYYICIDRPLKDVESELRGRDNEGKESENGDDHDEVDEHEDDDEDEDEKASKAYAKARDSPKNMHGKIPAEHPEWKWTTMVDTWKMYVELVKHSSYCD